jgi:asparagine synthase (glutamine-hydrolysing)
MCGIVGAVDLAGARPIEAAMLTRVGNAACHRGPDETGYLREPGLGLVSHRLSIVGLGDGQQPIFNEEPHGGRRLRRRALRLPL